MQRRYTVTAVYLKNESKSITLKKYLFVIVSAMVIMIKQITLRESLVFQMYIQRRLGFIVLYWDYHFTYPLVKCYSGKLLWWIVAVLRPVLHEGTRFLHVSVKIMSREKHVLNIYIIEIIKFCWREHQ